MKFLKLFSLSLITFILIGCNNSEQGTGGVREAILADIESIQTNVAPYSEADQPMPGFVLDDLVQLDWDYTDNEEITLSNEEQELIEAVNTLAGINIMLIESLEESDSEGYKDYKKEHERTMNVLKPYFSE